MNKKLSILIPIFNEENTLKQLLDKVVAVQLPENTDKEVILINDCSRDNSEKIILDYH